MLEIPVYPTDFKFVPATALLRSRLRLEIPWWWRGFWRMRSSVINYGFPGLQIRLVIDPVPTPNLITPSPGAKWRLGIPRAHLSGSGIFCFHRIYKHAALRHQRAFTPFVDDVADRFPPTILAGTLARSKDLFNHRDPLLFFERTYPSD